MLTPTLNQTLTHPIFSPCHILITQVKKVIYNNTGMGKAHKEIPDGEGVWRVIGDPPLSFFDMNPNWKYQQHKYFFSKTWNNVTLLILTYHTNTSTLSFFPYRACVAMFPYLIIMMWCDVVGCDMVWWVVMWWVVLDDRSGQRARYRGLSRTGDPPSPYPLILALA